MRVFVTCGPSYTPIDDVRRITNFSTGTLGVRLANAFAAAGHEVTCWKGEAATTDVALSAEVSRRTFTTNDDLATQLQQEAGRADVVLHAAALGDYEVDEVRDEAGDILTRAKIPSRTGALFLRLRPARKLITSLRDWFPSAHIVGWKYELNGGRSEAVASGLRQIQEARTDLCVLNGSAYGEGFGLLWPDERLDSVSGATDLSKALLKWIC